MLSPVPRREGASGNWAHPGEAVELIDMTLESNVTAWEAPGVGPDEPRVSSRGAVEILLCEDHEIYLAGLRALLGDDPGFEVVGESADIAAACALSDDALARVVVVARHGLLHRNEYEALRYLSGRGAAVLVLAESESKLELELALRAGARGYLSPRLTAKDLRNAVRSLARDEPAFDIFVAQHLVRYVAEELRRPPESDVRSGPLSHLTERQRTVALLVAEGLTNDEIAARLHVSQATIKSHLATVMRRLDIRSRTQLAILMNRIPRAS